MTDSSGAIYEKECNEWLTECTYKGGCYALVCPYEPEYNYRSAIGPGSTSTGQGEYMHQPLLRIA
jgi:hypothetical protein